MGVDFCQRTENTIKVSRDKDRIALTQGDLFTRCFESPADYELLKLEPGVALQVGDEVNIEWQADRVVAVMGDRVIGSVEKPCQALREMLDEYGIVGGRVDDYHESAGVAEIEIIP
jgi:hypothetical protein